MHLWIQYMLIRESRDQRLFDNYPRLIAVFHARHRLLMPRHPPCALSSLTTNIQNSLPLSQLAEARWNSRFKLETVATPLSSPARASRREQTLLQVTIALSIRLARTGLSTNASNAFLLRDRARYTSLPISGPCEPSMCKSMHLHEDAIYTTTKLSKIISRLTDPKACPSCHPLDGKLVRQNDETASRSVAGVPRSGKA